ALYALRKQTPEPVFGIIKSVLGFRQFSLRGLEKVRGEWSLGLEHEANVRPRPRLLKAGCPQRREYPAPTDSIATPPRPDRAPIAAATREGRFEDQLQELSPTGC